MKGLGWMSDLNHLIHLKDLFFEVFGLDFFLFSKRKVMLLLVFMFDFFDAFLHGDDIIILVLSMFFQVWP